MGTIWLEQLGAVDSLVFYIFCAVAALNLVLALAVIFLGCLVDATSPGYSMDFYVAFGSIAFIASVLLQGLDPTWGERFSYESICQVAPAVLVFAACWFFGGLLMKPCAIYHYHSLTDGAKIRGREWKPNLWMFVLMAVDLVAILAWVLIYPMQLAVQIPQSTPAPGKVDDVMYECQGPYSAEWKIGMTIYHLVILLLAAAIVWAALSISRKRPTHGEVTILSVIIYNIVFVAIAGALVGYFYDGSETILYAILGGLIMYAIFVTLLLLIVAKLKTARKARRYAEEHYAEVEEFEEKGAPSSYRSSGLSDNVTPAGQSAEVFTY